MPDVPAEPDLVVETADGAFCGAVLGMMVTMPLYHYIVPLVKPDKR